MAFVLPIGWWGRPIDPHRSIHEPPRSNTVCVQRSIVPPVTLAEAVLHLRLDPAAATGPEAPLITSMILAATRMLEQYGNLAVMQQDWRMSLHHWPLYGQGLTLPRPPFAQLLMVTVAGDPISTAAFVVEPDDRFAATMYPLDGPWPLQGAHWDYPEGGADWDDGASVWDREMLAAHRFAPFAVVITYRCGVSDPAEVPPDIKQALLMAIATWYENRESLQQFTLTPMLEIGWQALLEPYREVGFA